MIDYRTMTCDDLAMLAVRDEHRSTQELLLNDRDGFDAFTGNGALTFIHFGEPVACFGISMLNQAWALVDPTFLKEAHTMDLAFVVMTCRKLLDNHPNCTANVLDLSPSSRDLAFVQSLGFLPTGRPGEFVRNALPL